MRQRSRFHPVKITLLVACLLLPVSWLAYQVLANLEKQAYARSLQERANSHFQSVKNALDDLETLLISLRSFIELSPRPDRQAFNHFVSAHPITDYGIASVEWVPKVAPQEVRSYVERAREEGIFDFSIASATQGAPDTSADLFPIYFSSSAQMDELSKGRDLARSASYQEVMRQSADSRQPRLGIDSDGSIRLFLPVYQSDTQTDSAGYESLRGFVSAHFNAKEVINVLLGSRIHDSSLCLQIQDTSSSRQPILYQSKASQDHRPCRYYDRDSLRMWETTYRLAGAALAFRFFDKELPSYQAPLSRPRIAVAALLLITLLGLAYLYTSMRYARRVEALVQDRTLSLRSVENEYQNLFMQAIDGVYRATAEGRLLKINPAFAHTFGYQSTEAMLAQVQDIGTQLHDDADRHAEFVTKLTREGRIANFEWQGRTREGQTIWVTENAYFNRHSDGTGYYEGSINVITERKHAEMLLKHQAEHDALTGLVNRHTFVRQLDQHLRQRQPNMLCGLFFIDLDRFKLVNDTLGHPVGDELLIQFAQRLRDCLRDSDRIARFGGDEFAVLVPHKKTPDQITACAERILQSSQRPFVFENGKQFKTTASIGIYLIDGCINCAEEVLRNADTAMYEVKRSGRGHQVVFDDSHHQQLHRRNQIALLLGEALEQEEFRLWYQPLVDLKHGQISGFEALLRWRSPQLGTVSPDEFIPIAEEAGLIVPLGDWVLKQALDQLHQLIRKTGNRELFVNINMAPQQLLDGQIADRLIALLRQYRLQPCHLNIEITESAIFRHESLVVEHLRQIQHRGIGIYIDDFGTGHSSLHRLINYPVTGLKIDRSFVNQIDNDEAKAVVVKATLMMAELLDLNVTAEGIENEQQLVYLQRARCALGQGYLLHRPMPAQEVEQLLFRGRRIAGLIANPSPPPVSTVALLDSKPSRESSTQR